jgi:phage tail sheath gpL-like
MKVKQGFVLRDVAEQTMVVATGDASRDFHGMIKLNATGKLIWEGVAAGKTAEQIANDLVAEYDVAPEVALQDTQAIITQMQENGFVEE